MERNTTYLKELLLSRHKEDVKEPSEYRYIIYARKSTDEEGKQEYSIEDQITVCKEYCEKEEIQDSQIVEIIQERKSARESGKRPQFTRMMNLVKNGKVDGIISRHPNRLARNMKEAGEIIDLLDKKQLKTLQFASFTFTNDKAGKTLLGISFVMSKLYSDDLSDAVKGGQKHHTERGSFLGNVKPGYRKDKANRLIPDGAYYDMMKKAWAMRVDGSPIAQCAEYLKKNKFTTYWAPTQTKPARRKSINITTSWLSPLFKDPVYTGVLEFGDNYQDLTGIYDFQPMVSVEDFLRINKKLDDIHPANQIRNKGHKGRARLLRGMVTCGHCGKTLTAGITKKKTKNYYYLRCENKECEMCNKGVPPRKIITYVINELEHASFDEKEFKKHFNREISSNVRVRKDELRSESSSLTAKLSKLQRDKKDVENLLRLYVDEKELQSTYKDQLKDILGEINDINESLDGIKTERGDLKKVETQFEQFLKLWERIPTILRNSKSQDEIQYYISKIFSNFVVKDKEVVSAKLNPPYDKYLKLANSSVVGDTGLEPVTFTMSM